MGLHPTLAAIKRNLPGVARDLGFSARVTSGYRSRSKQTWLYNRWLQGLQEYPVAPPGTSDHERGLALDVVSTDTGKLVDLLTSVGLSWAGPADPVHFSMISRPSSSQDQIVIPATVKTAIKTAVLPPPLRVLDFWMDPLGAIGESLETALQVVGFL